MNAVWQLLVTVIGRPAVRRAAVWLLRAALLLAMIPVLTPRPAYVVAGPPQVVETEHPILCVHTRLNDEVEEWKIQRSLQMVREMGAATIVEFFPWAYIEQQPGQYRWGHFDTIVRHARAQGLNVIARIGLVPAWAQPDPRETGVEVTLNYIDETMFPDLARFVEALTARYRGDVSAIIVWNEPNLAFEWGFQPVSPERYVEMLRAVTPAARRGNPDVVVLAGALAPTLEPAGSPHGMNESDFLTALYEAGFKDTFDGLAVHTYGFQLPHDAPPAPDVLNFRRFEMLHTIMQAYGDGNKPIFITEMAWNDHPRWERAVRPGQRIAYTIGALEYAEASWPQVEATCIWVLRYPAPTRSYPDNFTLIADDFTPRPIYLELQAWARGAETAFDPDVLLTDN